MVSPPISRMGRSLPVFIPAILLFGVWLTWLTSDGGFYPRDSYPALIGLLVLLGVVFAAGGRVLPPGRGLRVCLLLLASVVAWSYLSVLWAASPAGGIEAAHDLLLYLVVAWIVALAPWRPGACLILLGAWSLAVAIFTAVALLEAPGDPSLGGLAVVGRFAEPIGYPNGSAAAAALGALAALWVSCSRETPAVLQVPFLAVAAFLAQFALLPQSRGAVLALAVTLPVLLALASDRWRLLARLAVIGGAVALSAGAIVDVQQATGNGPPPPDVLDSASRAMGLASLFAGLCAAALAVTERSLSVGGTNARRLRQAAAAAGALLAVLVLAIALLNAGRIWGAADDAVDSLRTDTLSEDGETRFSTLDPEERPDYWRVAIDLFEDHPLVGVGVGNFERHYTERRHEAKHSRYVHSIPLRALSEGGIVGAALLLALVLALIAAAISARRGADPSSQAILAVAVASGFYLLLHGSVDWLDEVPAITAPTVAFLFMALRVQAGSPEPRGSRWTGVAGAAVALSAALVVAPAYLSVRFAEQGVAQGFERPDAAFRDLDRAAELNPLSPRPHFSAGTLAVALDLPNRARREFHEALDVEEHWYPHFQLALLDAQAGRFPAARRELERAEELNMGDFFLARARERIDARRRIDPAAFNRFVLRETRSRFTNVIAR